MKISEKIGSVFHTLIFEQIIAASLLKEIKEYLVANGPPTEYRIEKH